MSGDGRVIITMTGVDQTTPVINQVKKQLQSLATAANNSGQSIGNAGASASVGLRSISSAASGAISTMAGFVGAQVIMTGFSKAVNSAGEAFIGYNARMEQTSMAYETMLQSASAAMVFINNMKDFAAKTPFEFDDVDKAAKRFLAMGWAAKDIIPDLTAVGNAASALGLSGEGIGRITLALGQMNIKAKLSGEEIRQLNEAGIGAQKYLADAFKLTSDAFDDLSKTGISGAQAVKAIIQGMANDTKYKDMMQKQSQTMIGLWSTLKDTSIEIFGAIGQGAFDSSKKAISAFAEMASKMVTSLRAGGVTQMLQDLLPPEWALRVFNMGQGAVQAFGLFSAGVSKTMVALEPMAGVLWDITASITGGLLSATEKIGTVAAGAFKIMSDNAEETKAVIITLSIAMTALYSAEIIAGIGIASKTIASIGTAAVEARIAIGLLATEGVAGAGALAAMGGSAGAVGSAVAFMTNPITIVIGAIALLVGAAYYFRDNAAPAIQGAAESAIDSWNGMGSAAEANASRIEVAADRAKRAMLLATGGPEDSNVQRHKDKLIYNGEQALAAHKGTGGIGAGVGKVNTSGANKVENAREKLGDILGSLQQKVLEETGTAFQISTQKLANEVLKIQNDLKDISKLGINTSPAAAKLAEYQILMAKKASRDQIDAQNTLKNETMSINAEITGNYEAAAEAQYQATVQSIQKQLIEKQKLVGDPSIAKAWETAMVKKAEDDKVKAVIDGEAKIHAARMQGLEFQNQVMGMSTESFRQAYAAELQAFVDSNIKKLTLVEQFSDKWKAIVQSISEANAKQHKMAGQDMSTAWKEAMFRINQDSYDYADRIKQAWGEMSTSITGHIANIFQGTETLGEGLKGIFSDITQNILKMWIDMAVQMYVMNPLKQLMGSMMGGGSGGGGFLGNLFGGGSGGGGNIGPQMTYDPSGMFLIPRASGGDVYPWQTYMVGEKGPEIFRPAGAGTIIPNKNLSSVAGQGGNVTNVHMTINTPDADSFRSSKRQIVSSVQQGMSFGRA